MFHLEKEEGNTGISFFNRQIIKSAESIVAITVAAATPKTPSLNNTTNMRLISLKQDEYKAVLPVNHPLVQKETLDYKDLNEQPFLLLEHGGKTEVSELLEKHNVHPNIRFTTWKDYAIMAMVEKGLGIGVLPEMILKCVPYQIAIRSFRTPYFREIVLAMKDRKKMTPAVEKFIEYLKYKDMD